jgi:hypothetical protein
MDASSIVLLTVSIATLAISLLDTIINGYIGVMDKKLYSSCFCGSSEPEPEPEPEHKHHSHHHSHRTSG